ncbi:MAG TPA: M20/M25/M40 family metallo-hydrolase [Steroidobacteraceae bacterium]
MDTEQLRTFISHTWDDSIIERLTAYVRIPNKSPMFDPHWERNGHMDAAIELMREWCSAQNVPGLRVEVRRLPGRTPLLLLDVPGELPGCVLLYGHLDKQPEFTGWLPGLGPWEPVIRDGKLYGRGAADDGYAVFSSLTAVAALKAQKVPLPRCIVLIEACEESGSVDLPAHLDALEGRIPTPSLVICLDAECGNYEQVWCTTSLRGVLSGTLRVRVLTEGVHSGMATGIAPTAWRIAQQLLLRLENPVTGDVLLDELQVPVPRDRRAQIESAASVLGESVAGKLPFARGVRPLSNDPVELLINSTWRPALAVTGADGFPPVGSAGNVLLPQLTFRLSLRLGPTTDAQTAIHAVKQALERDPPYAAQVSFEDVGAARGWNAPALAPWLEQALQKASRDVYGREAVYLGCGGSIPFMAMLGERYPDTQFFITGVLGPHANAHGPNEFLHIDYARRLTICVAHVLAAHAQTL